MHHLTVGDFELTAVSDGTYHVDGCSFFGVVPQGHMGEEGKGRRIERRLGRIELSRGPNWPADT